MKGLEYSYCYILFTLYLIILVLIESNYKIRRRDIMWLTIPAYLFFFGLRGFVGSDYYNYYLFFENLPVPGDTDFWREAFVQKFEVGFTFYTLLVKSIWNNYFFFIFINTLIDIWLLSRFIRNYSKYYAFPLLIFMVMNGIMFEIDFLRNMKSILLFMLSIRYIEEKKFGKFLFLNLIGVTFHISALLYIPLYFFINKPFPVKLFWILFITSNLLFLLKIPYLATILVPLSQLLGGRVAGLVQAYFMLSEAEFYTVSLGYAERLFTACIITYFYKQLIAAHKHNLIFINSLFYYLILFYFFGEVKLITTRVPYLFFFAYAVLIPQIYFMIQRKLGRQLFILGIIFYSVLKINGLTGNILYKYDNILFEYQRFEDRNFYRDNLEQFIL